MSDNDNIVTNAAKASNLTTLVSAVQAAGLAETLRDDYGLKGRWVWYGWHGQGRHDVTLCTQQHGMLYIQGFQRCGMNGAQPVFPDGGYGMTKAMDVARFEVCPEATDPADPRVYRGTIRGLRNPVAEYMAAVDAETVLALLDEIDRLRAELAEATS